MNGSSVIHVKERDVPLYIERYVAQGLKSFHSNHLTEAVCHLRNGEILIDTFMQVSEGSVSAELMLAVVLNLGICFYKVGLFDEAYSCFENSDLRIKKRISEVEEEDDDVEDDEDELSGGGGSDAVKREAIIFGRLMRMKKLRLQLNLQTCILFSEIGKHEDALIYARKSSKIALNLLLDSRVIGAMLMSEATSEVDNALVEKWLPVLEFINGNFALLRD